MTVRFPIKVEIALSADLTDPSSWSWTDITTKAYVRGAYTSRRGRGGWQTTAQPSALTLTLNNRDGRFSRLNPTGPYYGQLRKNTPVRVSIDPGSGYVVRATGFVSDWPTEWDLSESDFWVDVRADGILRRLQQGVSPARSALTRAVLASSPVAYWPMEDGSSSVSFASGLSDGAALRFAGSPSPGSAETVAGSLPVATFDTISSYAVASIVGATAGQIAVSATMRGVMASTPHPTLWTPWRITFIGGTVTEMSAVVFAGYSGGAFTATVETDFRVTPGGVISTFGTAYANIFDPAQPARYMTFTATQNGANIDLALWVDGTLLTTGSAASQTLGTPALLYGPTPTAGVIDGNTVDNTGSEFILGQVSVHDTIAAASDIGAAAIGHIGELASDRFARLCLEEGVPADVAVGSTATMGTQPVGTLVDLLRECEAAEEAVMVERRDGKLGLDPPSIRYDVTPTLALDYAARQIAPPFRPTDDDRLTRNDVTVTLPDGSSARAVDQTGPLGVDAAGRYDEEVQRNLADIRQAYEHAGWRVNLGTVNEYRYPSVILLLHKPTLSSLLASIVSVDIGDRITIDNLPSTMPPDLVDLVVEGINEQADNYAWTIELVCSPYKPFKVFELADTTADQNEWVGRLAGDDAKIRAAIDDNDTSIDVDPNVTRFTTTADDFDPDIRFRLGGEVITVSSISTTAATYVGRGAMSSADNAAVSPATTGFGAADGDLLCCLGRIRGTAGSLAATAGWDLMAQVGKLYLWGQIRSGTTPITLTPSGGAAGDTVSGTVFALHNMPTTVDPSDLVLEVLSQSNGSAQDIAFPGILPRPYHFGVVVFLLAGKSDDWTSVAVPAGLTESGEPSTTTGNDQGLYLAYQIQTTPALVSGGSAVVTGGAAAVSEAMILSLAAGYQTFTVSARSVNGTVKSHSASTPIEVEDGFPLAL